MAVLKQFSDRSTNPETILTGLTTANNTESSPDSSSFGNDSEGDIRGDAELLAEWGSAPTVGAIIELHIKATIDGTNFITLSSPQTHYGNFVVATTATSQRLPLYGIELPRRACKFSLINRSGPAFTSGTTLKLYYSKYSVT